MLGASLAGLLAAAAAALYLLDSRSITPRALAPYVAKRSSGHNKMIVNVGEQMRQALLMLDRGDAYHPDPDLLDVRPGEAALPTEGRAGRAISVANVEDFRTALANAEPGDQLTLEPGYYAVKGGEFAAKRPGTADNPIVVRAAVRGTVTLATVASVGFKVTAPYWTFENLTIHGACTQQQFCEHAFHVVGDAHHFNSLNNTIVDFNSHFKINGRRGLFPDHGAIIGNTVTNRSIRNTNTSVTLIDLVSGSHWIIRGNVITDFIKGGSDRISYGAFAKGAGSHNVFEQNIVICEHRLRGPGQRVGISLGGGGTGKRYCRDGRCITEQDNSVIRANLIASCSDDGIYLNSAARSVVSHNTILDTGGVVVRFAESSADMEGNLVDGAIRSRDGGILRERDNVDTSIAALYAGHHPVRSLFAGQSVTRLAWDGETPRRRVKPAGPVPDLCGQPRPALPAYGAFETLSACHRQAPGSAHKSP